MDQPSKQLMLDLRNSKSARNTEKQIKSKSIIKREKKQTNSDYRRLTGDG